MEDQDPIAAGDELARAEELALQADKAGLTEEAAPEDEDLFELELDGQVHVLPGALKGSFLRQADYTRKTQELAEQRRALEAERQALARGGGAATSEDEQRLTVLDYYLAEFQDVDWQAYEARDPQGARRLWGKFEDLAQTRERLAEAVSHGRSRAELERARAAAERMAETGRTLSQEIEGWSPETAAKLVEYAQAFGVTLEELSEAADARLWKLLHKAWRADQASQQDAATRAQAIRPAVRVTGAAAGGGGVRDELGTKEWMARRNEQTARGR
ncbi:hypothetical protein ACO2Q0_03060 [Phenylobacterium sp. VNQ135]|uniref:hypothetical protein n=1 Tax=Phenylobacterium sp. VNQ135 TaxID=3400922 RepID=UPI003C0CD269